MTYLDEDTRLTIQHAMIDMANKLVEGCEPEEARVTLTRVRDHIDARVGQCWPSMDSEEGRARIRSYEANDLL